MSKNKNGKTNKEKEQLTFFEKMRTDKKYSAKIQFLGYGLFILLIIVYLNIENAGNNMISNTVDSNNNLDNKELVEEEKEEVSLLNKLNNNYEYDVNVKVVKEENKEIKYRYYGKSYDTNMIINKESVNGNNVYYNIDDYYYIKNDKNEYGLIQREQIYDLVDGKYIEVKDILKLLEKASLDHVVDSSDGAKESLYNLLVRDVVISNKTDDVVVIKLVENAGKITINIDYTNLIKVFDEMVQKCEIEYVYTNIGSVEEFSIMNEDKE